MRIRSPAPVRRRMVLPALAALLAATVAVVLHAALPLRNVVGVETASPPAIEARGASICGTVASSDGEPVAGATVSLFRSTDELSVQETRTTKSGRFVLT